MRILLSNDDGISSPGILQLADRLEKLSHDVWVVAPAQDRSTVGHSLTLHKPLKLQQIKTQHYSLSGSPADCVYMATRFLMKEKPDLVIAGVNHGANLGDDHYYSGTVAAAREGALYGIKSIAASLCLGIPNNGEKPHWDSPIDWICQIIPDVTKLQYNPSEFFFNLNVPNVPAQKIKGLRIAKQGRRYYEDIVTSANDPRRRPYFWVGGCYKHFEPIPESDCLYVQEGYASLVPLKIDSSAEQIRQDIKHWETSP